MNKIKLIRAVWKAIFALVSVCVTCSVVIADDLPGAGKTVRYARGSWDSFWVGGYIVQSGLERLGYKVEQPSTLAVNVIYDALATGQLQFTADGMMPLQTALMEKYKDSVEEAGEIENPASITGYLIDKRTSDQYGIQYLDQLKDPKLAGLFGADGKARMTGLDTTWEAETNAGVKGDVQRLGLNDTVNVEMGSYDLLMADAVARYRDGKPILLFSWYPNVYTQKLIPGKDLVWLSFRQGEGRPGITSIDGLPGCAAPGPSCYGVSSLTYYVMANKKWLAQNPAAAKFISLVKFSMADRGIQNLKMQEPGQRSDAAIKKYAEQWIASHKTEFDSWILQAEQQK
ncbi:glycine betaine/L-proline ABC transporter substrate-binding protein ProX [Caballeronia sp. LjRoot34]|uniref:glycine betaine/L-proline ABC transporter substrate-binding protein ProX n=1 Tax=Caballeronia sp. LjRoot34 TaxID=3342325 RepID=UPI003ED0293B